MSPPYHSSVTKESREIACPGLAGAGPASTTHFQSSRDDEYGAPPPLAYFGAAGYSSLSRMFDEKDAREHTLEGRTKRPTDKQQLSPAAMQAIRTGSHICRNKWDDNGEFAPCQLMLWARYVDDAVNALTSVRKAFSAKSGKERGKNVWDAISFPDVSTVHGEGEWRSPMARLAYRIGPSLSGSHACSVPRHLPHKLPDQPRLAQATCAREAMWS
eukprot:6186336-Pleurochrysis_carterae.AAC.1